MDLQETIIIITLIIVSLIAIIVLIPNVYRLYIHISKTNAFLKMGSSSKVRLIRQLDEAMAELSSTKTGALITITNKDDIEPHRTDGIEVDASISSQIIISIFNKKSPLHDGAIVIESNKIKYAATYYKITDKSISNKYGARHRAAMGICDATDALTIVVSEETGKITFAKKGEFHEVKLADFQEKLAHYLENN